MAVKFPQNAILETSELSSMGILLEANRQFFHPLGLSLTVVSTDGKTGPLVVTDYRHADPEGVIFDWDLLDQTYVLRKAAKVEALIEERRAARVKALGFWVQPLPATESAASTEDKD